MVEVAALAVIALFLARGVGDLLADEAGRSLPDVRTTGAVAPAEAQSGFTVIAHPDNGVTSVSKDELSKIFLKRLRTWADRRPTVPVDQFPSSTVREEFTRYVHERRVVNVEVYWKRLIFSGRAVPPMELPDDEEVLAAARHRVDDMAELALLLGRLCGGGG